MDNESTPPISVHRGKRFAAPLGFILFSIGILSTIVMAYADLSAATKSNEAELHKQEIRIDRLELLQIELAVIRKDVEWMRRTMEGRTGNDNRWQQRFDEPKIPNTR